MTQGQQARLVQALRKLGAPNTESFTELLAFLQAPPALFAIEIVLQNVAPVLRCVEATLDGGGDTPFDIEVLSEWISLTEWFSRPPNGGRVRALLGPDGIDHSTKRPLHGRLDEWPSYCALYYQHPDIDLRQAHMRLAAQLLLCQSQFKSYVKTDSVNVNSALLSGLRMLRLSADQAAGRSFSERQRLLGLLPVENLSQANYSKRLVDTGVDESSERHKQALVVVLRYAIFRTGARLRASAKSEVELEPKELYSRSNSVSAEVRVQKRPYSVTQKRLQELEREGASPDELLAGYEWVRAIGSESQTDQGLDQSPVAQVIRTRGVRHAIAMRNQQLSQRWDGLTLFEVAMLHNALFKIIELESRAERFEFSDYVTNLELATLLLSMFWTANPLSCALQLKRVSRSKTVQLAAGERHYCPDTMLWVVGALEPEYRSALPAAAKPYLVESRHLLVTAPHPKIAEVLSRWVNTRGSAGLLFEKDVVFYEQATERFLNEVNGLYATRLTQRRVEREFLHRLYKQGRDWVLASLVTGVPHSSAEIPMYYAAPRLCDVYDLAVCGAANLMGQILSELGEVDHAPVNLMPRAAIQVCGLKFAREDRVGCRTLVISGAVKSLVCSLRLEHQRALKRVGRPDYLIHLHNQLTLYVSLMISFSSGYRAVRDPLNLITSVDFGSGFAVISDKDGDDFYHSRVVWLPALVLEQLEAYRIHSRLLAQRLTIANESLSRALVRGSNPFMFLLDSGGSILKLGPKEVSGLLLELFPVPMNVGRAYLRNSLSELQLDGELLRWFMGHWDHGQEPYSARSSFSPALLKHQIGEKLERILHLDGWVVLRGLAINA